MHGDGDGGNPAESAGVGMNVAGIPRGWIGQLRDSRWDGFYYGGNPAGMVGELTGCENFWSAYGI